MNLDLSDDEINALRDLLRQTIDGNHYPFSRRLRPFAAILSEDQTAKAAR